MSDNFDPLDYDAVSESEEAIPVEMYKADLVTPLGLTMMVLGKHADAVTKANSLFFRKANREMAMSAKAKEKTATLEDLRAQERELASARVVGWKGTPKEFSKERLKAFLERNQHCCDLIVKASEDLGNFTKQP